VLSNIKIILNAKLLLIKKNHDKKTADREKTERMYITGGVKLCNVAEVGQVFSFGIQMKIYFL
jgi:hypothetical protein